jgi:hypothetical protein
MTGTAGLLPVLYAALAVGSGVASLVLAAGHGPGLPQAETVLAVVLAVYAGMGLL